MSHNPRKVRCIFKCCQPFYSFRAEEIPKLVTSEEKSLSRFGVVYGILRRLGFNEDHTMECLAHTNCFELDDALAWVRWLSLFHERSLNNALVILAPSSRIIDKLVAMHIVSSLTLISSQKRILW